MVMELIALRLMIMVALGRLEVPRYMAVRISTCVTVSLMLVLQVVAQRVVLALHGLPVVIGLLARVRLLLRGRLLPIVLLSQHLV